MAPPRVLVGVSICLSLDMCSRSCNCLILCIILCVFLIIIFHALLSWFICYQVGCICPWRRFSLSKLSAFNFLW